MYTVVPQDFDIVAAQPQGMGCYQIGIHQPQFVHILGGAHAVFHFGLVHLCPGFRQVRMDQQVVVLGVTVDVTERFFRYRINGVRTDGKGG